MKKVLLIRHGKSSWHDSGQDDFDRPLNARGVRDAPFMAQQLVLAGLRPQALVASSAMRALSTAEVFAKTLALPPEAFRLDTRLYMAAPKHLLQCLHALPNHWQFVALVGHNPGLTDCLNDLAGFVTHNIPTCGMFLLQTQATTWAEVAPNSARLVYSDIPRNYFPKIPHRSDLPPLYS